MQNRVSKLILITVLFCFSLVYAGTAQSKEKNPRVRIVTLSAAPNPFSPKLDRLQVRGTVDATFNVKVPWFSFLGKTVFWTAYITKDSSKTGLQNEVLYWRSGFGNTIQFDWDGRNLKGVIALDGKYVIKVKAWTPGNVDTKEISVTLDQTVPQVSLVSIQDVFTTAVEEVVINGSVNEPVQNVSIQGSFVSVQTDGTFSQSIKLTPGLNLIKIKAVDLAGNTSERAIQITYDHQPPVITVARPVDGVWTNQNTIRVEGVIDDPLAHILIREADVPVSGTGEFFAEVSLESEGENVILIVAEDLYGNKSEKAIKIYYDSKAPEIYLDPSGGIINTSRPALTVSYADSGSGLDLTSFSASIDGLDRTDQFTVENNQAQCVLSEFLSEGDHSWSVTLKDRVGNEMSAGASFTVQTEQPLTVDNILATIRNNYQNLQDMESKAVLTITYNNELFGNPEYIVMKIKNPDKERMETYTSGDYQTLKQTSLSSGGKIQIIDPNGEKVIADLAQEAGATQDQMKGMDLYYNQDEFKAQHNVSIIDGSFSKNDQTVIIQAIPNQINQIYDRIDLKVDISKGLVVQWDLYKESQLLQTMKVKESVKIGNKVWIATKEEKITPMYEDAKLIATMDYSDIKINQGLDSKLFEIEE